VTLKKERRE